MSLARHLNTQPWNLPHVPIEWLTWGAIHMLATQRIEAGLHVIKE